MRNQTPVVEGVSFEHYTQIRINKQLVRFLTIIRHKTQRLAHGTGLSPMVAAKRSQPLRALLHPQDCVLEPRCSGRFAPVRTASRWRLKASGP